MSTSKITPSNPSLLGKKQQSITHTTYHKQQSVVRPSLKKEIPCSTLKRSIQKEQEKAYRNAMIMECQVPLPYMMEMEKNSRRISHHRNIQIHQRNENVNLEEEPILRPGQNVNPLLSACCEFRSTHQCTSSSVKRFISHSSTHSLIRKRDEVLVNVDEDLSILNMVDATWHGQTGIVCEINDDECVVEIAEKNVAYEDHDSQIFAYTSEEGQMFFGENEEEHSYDYGGMFSTMMGQTKNRRIVLPIFCLCLEDRVLKERLAASLKFSRQQQVSSPKVMRSIPQTQSKSLVSCLS